MGWRALLAVAAASIASPLGAFTAVLLPMRAALEQRAGGA